MSDTPIYDALVQDLGFWEKAYLTRVTWSGVKCWALTNVPDPEDRNPPWMKRYDDVDQP